MDVALFSNISSMIKAIIFDWGNTIMRDYTDEIGPMYLWKKVSLIDGAEEILKKLHKNYLLCIASNAGDSDTSMMIKALRLVEAEKYFNFFYTSKDLGYSKPDPRFFTAIAKQIEIDCKNCMMVGNDYLKDIVGAKNVGMTSVFFNENNQKDEFIKADFIIKRLAELEGIV